MRLEDLRSEDLDGRSRVDDLVLDYLASIKSRSLKHCEAVALKSFFKHNTVPLSLKAPAAGRTVSEKIPTQNGLAAMIEVASIRGKALIAFLAQSGVRESTLCRLRYRNIKEDFEGERLPVHIHIEPDERTKIKDLPFYHTFIAADSVKYLKLYFKMRAEGSEKIPCEVIYDESPLFRQEESRRIIPIREASVRFIVRQAAEKAGLVKLSRMPRTKGPPSWSPIRPHSLRKFFETGLESANIPPTWIEHLMGHKTTTYSKPTVEQLREAYVKATPYLSLAEGEASIKQGKELQALKERIAYIESQIAKSNREVDQAMKEDS